MVLVLMVIDHMGAGPRASNLHLPQTLDLRQESDPASWEVKKTIGT